MNTPPEQLPQAEELNRALQHLKDTFVGKDDIADLMGISLVARENLFLLGPPGTAKSALVRELALTLNGRSFEYLLTRFTEPNEIFGPFDIRKLREGELVTNTDGMLPEANLIFLDELLNANSAILNSMLMVLNERVFRRGRERRDLPALMIVGASNHLPEDDALRALFDRFLLRVRCDYVDPQQMNELLDAGWAIEQKQLRTVRPELSIESVLYLQQQLASVNLQPVRNAFVQLISQLRNAGVPVSDRRAVKLQRLIAASALLCHRRTALVSDLWVMRYIWDTNEQRELIEGIVNAVVESDHSEAAHHPRARYSERPDPDALYAEVVQLSEQWNNPDTSFSERAVIKDRLRFLNGRTAWIANEVQRNYVQQPVDELWQKIIQSN
ncbi:MAG: AAA family ATPase [Bacteroidia bacterium]|jgi:MoxR-like ATPase|nr:AAA family ATPase [Bacteroidia bacterium]